ncbi:MAG: hypothetical protein DCC88_10360 [Spirobacillus cienkowskii]|jgi:hypothetical protein|uniref:Uncharacterized protein n=1 Tax=Spirobacillus cienkowskii TaxID=495820 RepID=A0A369KL92_9BACT|nr:MAG: hypothetical protein DCC88_10360 [Spirobacillus cienkowskii]
MNNKKIFCMSSILLTSTIFGFKNNQSQEKMSDFNFLEKHELVCQPDPSREGCSMKFNYKQEIINLQLVRKYEPNTNKIIIRKIGFKNDSSAGFFYGQILSSKNHIHLPFNDFINFIKNLTIVYSNDLNKIDIEINDASKDIILHEFKKFANKHSLTEDENYLNTLDPANFNYNDLKQLQFIAEDFSVLEAFLLDISIKNKEDIIPKKVGFSDFLKTSQFNCQSKYNSYCTLSINYNKQNINISFIREYNPTTQEITLRKTHFNDNSSAGLFYGQILSDKSRLHFPFNNFIQLVKHLNVYSNDLNTTDIEINKSSEEIIYNELKEYTKKHNLKVDEAYLNTIEPSDFHYSDFKKLQFISDDFSVLEKFLLELSIKNKEDIMSSNH